MLASLPIRRSTYQLARTPPTSPANILRPVLRPIFRPTFLQNLANMSDTSEKQGVHNLESKEEFDAALAIQDTLMVVDCFATWCGPCKVIAPEVVLLSKRYPQARFYKVDVDQMPSVAQELGVRAMPTFMLFKNGEKVKEVVGANPKALEAAVHYGVGSAVQSGDE